MSQDSELVFIKLGGSLITNKAQAHTPRAEVLTRLAGEIAEGWRGKPAMRLLVGHGSGSFGHVPAIRYGTRQGVHSEQEWRGFVEVWREAATLNHLVVEALTQAGLPAITLSPAASVIAKDGKIVDWNTQVLEAALEHGLLPVIQGDVVFDQTLGGTILSTEDLFTHLVKVLRPQRILLAGWEPGVWQNYPQRSQVIKEITPDTIHQYLPALGGSATTDVTGGMASKVLQAMQWVGYLPGLEVSIFSGEMPGTLTQALLGQAAGTVIRSA